MIRKGFQFGMLLQLAVGPICLLVFNASAKYGLWSGMPLVLAVTLVDALFIILSGLGVGAVLKREKVKRAIKVFGAAVLMLFGANMLAGALGLRLLPSIQLFANATGKSFFVQGLLLTASNPLTIIFWSGVFSTQVIEHGYDRQQLCWFGLGCVLSTLSFLTLVAVLGTAISGFLSPVVMRVLNAGVGCVLLFYGVRLLCKRDA